MGSCVQDTHGHNPPFPTSSSTLPRDRRLKTGASLKATVIQTKVFSVRHRLAVDFLVNSPHLPNQNNGFAGSGRQPHVTAPPSQQLAYNIRPTGSFDVRVSPSSIGGHCERPLLTYYLEVVQQPQRAAEFGASSLSRLPLAPPLIVQLSVRDAAGKLLPEDDELPFMICHLSLFRGDGSSLPNAPNNSPITNQPHDLLYGSLVSSPQVFRDLHGRQGIYFLFPDVSIRTRGQFQMRVSLIKLPSMGSAPIDDTRRQDHVLAETRTEMFEVLPRSEYIAPSQTALTRYFLQQGARMYAFESSVTRQWSYN